MSEKIYDIVGGVPVMRELTAKEKCNCYPVGESSYSVCKHCNEFGVADKEKIIRYLAEQVVFWLNRCNDLTQCGEIGIIVPSVDNVILDAEIRCNADFGPADGDVQYYMNERFEEKTGKRVPKNWSLE